MTINQGPQTNPGTPVLVRPVRKEDFDGVLHIAANAGPDFTSLPNHPDTIERKIQWSLESFSNRLPHDQCLYLFVMEHLDTQTVIGTAAIEANTSTQEPFYNYSIVHISNDALLFFGNAYQVSSMFGTLYVDPRYRGAGLGSFMSRQRGLFMAQHKDRFADIIIADMQGRFEGAKNFSPFWEALGKPFFNLGFKEAAFEFATHGSQFIEAKAPTFPIYIRLLSKEAQEAIGNTHEITQAARHVLEGEGFIYREIVDFFDAGPILEVQKEQIKTVQKSRLVKVNHMVSSLEEMKPMMISNTSLEYRATLGRVLLEESGDVQDLPGVTLETRSAEILNVSLGSQIRICQFR